MSAGTSHAPPYKCLLRHSRRSRRQALLALLTERAPSLSGLSFGISTGAFGNPYPRLAPGRPHIRLVPSRPPPVPLSESHLKCAFPHMQVRTRQYLPAKGINHELPRRALLGNWVAASEPSRNPVYAPVDAYALGAGLERAASTTRPSTSRLCTIPNLVTSTLEPTSLRPNMSIHIRSTPKPG
jgi:hypothetical protein